jgi:hypothetical protein
MFAIRLALPKTREKGVSIADCVKPVFLFVPYERDSAQMP